ncbi:MAG: rhomboid family intramembrane serine protease [Acidobacteriota bacterium]|nr:rhomboid family intramembrane serine protease [Blastocatellia bacterium]MDW8413080.1 rhomboid family intramembrane serine protease [Acidobacteriota bacterium]
MIPIKDSIPSRTYPIVNVCLIAINIVAFIFELSLGDRLDEFFRSFAVVPAKYYWAVMKGHPEWILYEPELWLPLFTSMFLHGGWLHLIGNMVYLWIFGDNVEDRMGHFRYVLFYLLCGLVASAAHILSEPTSSIPSLGASGAIAGVLGAYILLYPRSRVLVMIPIFVFLEFIEVPAFIFLGIWFLQQFVLGTLSLAETAQTGGVAWWAHIGGFVAGLATVYLFAKRDYREPEYDIFWDKFGRIYIRRRW